MKYGIEEQLHPDTKDLIDRFAVALAKKLYEAQVKYGHTNGWAADDWLDQCRHDLRVHLEKGDPLDVAAYCAFLWHHGSSTVDPIRERAMATYFRASRAIDQEL